MNDNAGPARRGGRGDALGLRLALAFLGVALAAIALLAGLTAAFAAADVSALASQQRTELTSAIAVAAGAAWDRNNSWASADLSPVLDLAERTGVAVQIRDQAGHPVASSPGFTAQPGPPSRAAVVVRGQRMGEAIARFTGSGLTAADRRLQAALLRRCRSGDAAYWLAGADGSGSLADRSSVPAMARKTTAHTARASHASAPGQGASRASDAPRSCATRPPRVRQ